MSFARTAHLLATAVLRKCAIADLRNCAIAQRCRTAVCLATVAAATILLTPPAAASDYVETEALFHARAIQEAFDTLATHIEDGSTAAVSWTGTTPPSSTGWLADWTARGLGARYCDNVLLVHVTTASMKGTGTNLGVVQLAPHLEAKARNRDVAPLHWLDAGTAEGILGRESITLPACFGTTPSDRPALAGPVVDPFTVTTDQVTFEHQARACPAGFHGTGQTWVREATQKLNGRGDPTGTPTTGPWSLLVDHCRADTVTWEYYRQSCTFTPGAPHVGTLTGDAVWRRQKSVTASGTSYGAPEFVSTTCWTDPNPTPPVPTETTSTTSETRSVSCGAGYTGSRTQRRTLTWRHLKWPWDASATVQRVSQTNWATSSNTCRRIPPPPPQCPQGQVGTPPNCVTPTPPPPGQCPQGQVGTPPNCVTPTTPQQCPQGQVGTPPNCVTPTTPQQCPQGQVGTPPNCTTPTTPQCPQGQVGTPPNCTTPTPPPPGQCPAGQTGTPPNCVTPTTPQQCPQGQVGTPPNCVTPTTPQQCPQGQVGTPPNCVTPTTPQQCPQGQVGTPPNCVTPTPPQCPQGQVGTPPNCTTPDPPKPPKKCVDRDKGGGCPKDSSGNNNGGRGGNVGGGWDTDGDGKADVADLSDVDEADRPNANYV
ncbi:MAG: hypothetical protein OXI95_05775, partial [bacterium]|nr:hypothetical protein [bacterium]